MVMLSNNIKQIRKERKISQQILADFLGMERTSLSKIENMQYNPRTKTMKGVSDFFDLPIGDIFFNQVVSLNNTETHQIESERSQDQ